MAPFNYFIVALFIPLCAAAVTRSGSYKAAVVEYHPVGAKGDDPSFILESNVAQFERIIKIAKQQAADIVVFPEYGLTGVGASTSRDLARQFAQTIPPPPSLGDDAPCLFPNSSMAIRRLSCSARENKIYVVVNLLETYQCNPGDDACNEDGVYIYNTNVAFDRDGGVLSTYHKYNLFFEPSVDRPKKPMYSIFDTDFGITFGMFICFDILFEDPAYTLVKGMNVKDFVFSTAWTSELPFLTAVQTQESWSFGLDVNLLASGYNNPGVGNGGSGIYAGRKGSQGSIMPSVAESVVLMADFPVVSSKGKIQKGDVKSHSDKALKAPTTNPVSSLMLLIHDDLSNYNGSDLLRNGLNDVELCQEKLCCKFHADVRLSNDGNEAPKYRFVITDSEIKYAGSYKAHVQVCGLVYCKGNDIKKCVYYPDDPATLDHVNFQSIRITGNFTSPRIVFPSTLATNLLPLEPPSGNLVESDGEIKFEYNTDVQGLLTFSLYTRTLERHKRGNKIPRE